MVKSLVPNSPNLAKKCPSNNHTGHRRGDTRRGLLNANAYTAHASNARLTGFVLSFKYSRWRTCTKTKSRKEECWIKCTENPTLTRHQEDCRKVHYSKAQQSTRMSVKTKRVRCVRHKDKRNEVPTPIGTASVTQLHVPRHERSRPEWKQWQARTDAILNRMSSSWSLNYAE